MTRGRSRWAPEPAPGHRLLIDLMPFASDIVGGVLGRVVWLYTSRSGIWVQARLGPTGVALSDGDQINVFDSGVSVGWSARLFSIGVGGGAAYLRIDEGRRRAVGLNGVGLLHLRGGALDGVHGDLTLGASLIGGDPVFAGAALRVRVPLRPGPLDIEIGGSAASWAYGMVSIALALGDDDTVRIRPHVGAVQVVDDVFLDGGVGFSIGVGLLYREPADPE